MNMWSYSSGGQRSKIKVHAGSGFLEKLSGGRDGESFLVSSSFWGLQALLDIPWLVAAALQSLRRVSWPSSPCVSKPPSYKDTGHRI